MNQMVFLIVSLGASVIGAICGIGGGIIIKPVLDVFGLASVSTVSFLSSCTVLSMSCYSVGKAMWHGEQEISVRTSTPLAIGAAIGGVIGQRAFTLIKGLFSQPNTVGAVQAVCLFVITLGTLVYSLKKESIAAHHVTSPILCTAIGLALGIMSSFLGIGGGPINLVVLRHFFSMKTKTAAQNSLYIILFSQLANMFTLILSATVPAFSWLSLGLMVAGGLGGGMIGRKLHEIMNSHTIDHLFIGLMIVIMLICIWNTYRYAIGM